MVAHVAPKLAVLRAKPILKMMREMKEQNLDISTIIDHRPDGRGDEIRARFFSVYSLENVGGPTDRVVAHLNRGGFSYPSILKVDSNGRFAIDGDIALQSFDMRGGSIGDAYAKHPDFKTHINLQFDDNAFVRTIEVGATNRPHGVDRPGPKSVVTVDVPQ